MEVARGWWWWWWDRMVGGNQAVDPIDVAAEPPSAQTLCSPMDESPESSTHPTLPTPTFRRLRPLLPRPTVATIPFRPARLEVRPATARDSVDSPRRVVRRLTRATPPPGVPLRDRLESLLQPPLDFVLGDHRLFMPFEPFPYQYDGIAFLAGRWGAILADEMGLGKTMQSAMAIRLLLRSRTIESVLLICPKPLVSNWRREFSLWAEEMPIAILPTQAAARRHFWIHDPTAIKIANYESVARDEEIVNSPSVHFDLVVLDEAQRIKNRDARIASVVRRIRRKRSWALTGTPVENRADDLMSLLDFVHNRETGNWHEVTAERTEQLRDAVSEVILRRTKDLVMNDLPARLTRDIYIDLGPEQRHRYDSAEKDGVIHLGEMGEAITIEHVFKLIGQLKHICNIDPVTGQSAKMDQLRDDLDEVVASGKKAIVFSQYVTTLDEIARRLSDWRPLVYHGGVPHRQRDEIIRQFREEADRPILCLSYGTGAVGLNLQFSNYVFLFDRWWNPAIEDQAINRAHRIGQKDKVLVTRYICPETIESRIAQVLEQKRELFASLIDGHEPSAASMGLSAQEIFGLFDLKLRPPARAA